MFTLFKNEDVFSPEYTPDVFLYREAQMNSLQYCLKPALRNQRPLNALLVGTPATGKTTAIKIALAQLEEASNAICVHVNCSNVTAYRILAEIHRKVIGFLPPETGVPISKLQDAIFKKLAKEKRPLVVALDDVIDIKGVENAMYTLLRAHEHYPSTKTGLIVASVKNGIHKLDDRVHSSFRPEIINFNPYAKQQVADILKKRSEAGLHANAAPLDIIKKIAEASPDVRMAIETLRSAAIKAESTGQKTIKPEHVSFSNSDEPTDSCVVLDTIRKKNPIDSGSLYKMLGSTLSYSKFYRTLKKLESEGKISLKEISKGRGKSRMIGLNA